MTYGLGIYTLNLLIGFLTPQGMTADEPDGPALPTKGDEEFKPFVRKLPEFKFWYAMAKAVCTALTMTFFSFFDIPVFWPILLMYWVLLFGMTMKKQIKHMVRCWPAAGMLESECLLREASAVDTFTFPMSHTDQAQVCALELGEKELFAEGLPAWRQEAG